MRPFAYERVASVESAVDAASWRATETEPPTGAPAQFLAGGTTILDLMKLDVMRPEHLVDINALQHDHDAIEVSGDGLRLSAMARMSDVANHATIMREYPVIAQSLSLAASQQLRNMATLGGNVLQRTRCTYFRDVTWTCNKREPGSGCSAMGGFNRMHAILGTSDACIATYPGDFAQALIALDADVHVFGRNGYRTLTFAQLHRAPGEAPQVETTLAPGDLITGFTVRAGPWTRRSLYLKIRDRASYEFALASAAVALDMDGDTVREARIALGGVATVPWRAHGAEAALAGKRLDEAVARAAAEVAFADATTHEHNAFKVPLGKETLTRALLETAGLEQ